MNTCPKCGAATVTVSMDSAPPIISTSCIQCDWVGESHQDSYEEWMKTVE